jgi:hypothetical protein
MALLFDMYAYSFVQSTTLRQKSRREVIGFVVALYCFVWLYIGFVLALYCFMWLCIGFVLALYWLCTGFVLLYVALYWPVVGVVVVVLLLLCCVVASFFFEKWRKGGRKGRREEGWREGGREGCYNCILRHSEDMWIRNLANHSCGFGETRSCILAQFRKTCGFGNWQNDGLLIRKRPVVAF